MTQQLVPKQSSRPRHVAIIMDGNGRWATERRLPREFGHLMGAKAVLRVSDAAAALRIRYLTLFAFSSDNWKRSASEVRTIMTLIERYLRFQALRAIARGTRVSIIGRRDRIPVSLRRTIEQVESSTSAGDRLLLRIAVDYSAREAMLRAVGRLERTLPPDAVAFRMALATEIGDREVVPDVDLMIRTGGEQRLSDFLLWEGAYAELLFVDKMWPGFAADDLARAVQVFRLRNRRFGSFAPELYSEAFRRKWIERNRTPSRKPGQSRPMNGASEVSR